MLPQPHLSGFNVSEIPPAPPFGKGGNAECPNNVQRSGLDFQGSTFKVQGIETSPTPAVAKQKSSLAVYGAWFTIFNSLRRFRNWSAVGLSHLVKIKGRSAAERSALPVEP